MTLHPIRRRAPKVNMSETHYQIHDGALGAARPPLRLAPAAVTPREQMTARELQYAARDHQAGIGLECEVRRLAREHGLELDAVNRLGESARAAFRIVDGEPVPVAADRQTVLLAADGVNVLGVADWVGRQVRALGLGLPDAKGQWQGPEEDEILPMRNPFRAKTWNLTEQMKLQRRDPKLARRLKAEAYADGESLRTPTVKR